MGKLKIRALNLSKIAKELALKIKGDKKKKKKKGPKKNNKKTCNLGSNLEKLKKKGLLKVKQGKCNVACKLKPSDQGIDATCDLLADKRALGCKKLLYTRAQAVAAGLMSQFDAFKECTVSKASKPKKAPKALGEDSERM